ncbi:MAG: acyl carrier protein [Raoultibacter sp.]
METIDTIKSILNENLNIAPETVTEDSTFESLNIDSLDMVELVCNLEDECNIDFGDPDDLETVSDLVKYVDSLK